MSESRARCARSIDAVTAQHTHSQVGGPEGALHAFESLYAGLVAAEPDVLD